jgi:hypothetical protein
VSCQHPPEKNYTGFFDPSGFEDLISGKKAQDYVSDTLWVACTVCGEVIRPAPLAVRLEAMFAQQEAVE